MFAVSMLNECSIVCVVSSPKGDCDVNVNFSVFVFAFCEMSVKWPVAWKSKDRSP